MPCLLPCTVRQLSGGFLTDTCPHHSVGDKLLVIGVVVAAKLQVGKLAGSIGSGVMRLDLGSGFIGSTHQGFQIHGDLVCHGFSLIRLHSFLFVTVVIKGTVGNVCRTVCFLNALKSIDAGADLILDILDLGSSSLPGFFFHGHSPQRSKHQNS